MQKLIILNTREIKKIREMVEKEFGYFSQEDYAYLQNQKNRIFLVNKDLARIDTQKLKIDKLGLYFGELRNGEMRLSKEGAQFLAKEAKKNKVKLTNVVKLSKEEVKTYFLGEDLEKDLGEENHLVLLEYEGDVLGCAKYKDKTILNFMPKMYRGEVIL